MFSLFNRKKVTIQSVSIPDSGWMKSKDNGSIIQWINPEQTIAVSVNFFDLPPDIPTVKNLEVLKDFYRTSISNIHGGLIQADLLKIQEIPSAKIIVKLPQESSGMTYLASLTIPFENCSFVLKVQCAEVGPTGMRDAVIADKLLASGEVKFGDNGLDNWFFDPYDKSYKSGTLMNLSEQEIYDSQFPDHPLTQARKWISNLEKHVTFSPEVKKLKKLNR
jgi:hypothetical protein